MLINCMYVIFHEITKPLDIIDDQKLYFAQFAVLFEKHSQHCGPGLHQWDLVRSCKFGIVACMT